MGRTVTGAIHANNMDRVARMVSITIVVLGIIVGLAVAWGSINARIDYIEARTIDLAAKWEATQSTLVELLVQIGVVQAKVQHVKELLEQGR